MVKTYDTDCDGYLVESDNGIVVRVEDYEELKRENERLKSQMEATCGVGNGDGSMFVHGDYDSVKAVQSIIFDNERLQKENDNQSQTIASYMDENEQLRTEVKRLVAVRNEMGETIGDHVNEIAALKNAMPEIAARAVERAGELIRYEMEGPKDCDSLEEFLDRVATKIRTGEVKV